MIRVELTGYYLSMTLKLTLGTLLLLESRAGRKRMCVVISAHVLDHRVVEIDPESSTIYGAPHGPSLASEVRKTRYLFF